jgi:hypothetical protein
MSKDIHTLISEVKEALEKATPGPWTYYRGESYTSLGGWESEYVINEVDNQREQDAYLIANSITWLQQLVTGLEEAHRENERLYDALEHARFLLELEKYMSAEDVIDEALAERRVSE